jgi:two-component system response regulator (stage 0 sporulation protein A)
MITNQENTIISILKELCVPACNKGFRYLVTAISAVLEDESRLDSIMGLYGIVAKAHDTTVSKAERAIRHSIECSYSRADMSVISKYFGFCTKKVTNSDFIASIYYDVKTSILKEEKTCQEE